MNLYNLVSKKLIISVIIVVIIIVGWVVIARNRNRVNLNPASSEAQIASERETIIAAIINQQQTLTSKDPQKIKEYFTKLSVTEEDKKDLSKVTNQDLLKLAEALTTVTITADDLRDKTAVWNVSSDIAVVRITKMDKPVSFIVQKIDGVWY